MIASGGRGGGRGPGRGGGLNPNYAKRLGRIRKPKSIPPVGTQYERSGQRHFIVATNPEERARAMDVYGHHNIHGFSWEGHWLFGVNASVYESNPQTSHHQAQRIFWENRYENPQSG
jgi:hypothetical protein